MCICSVTGEVKLFGGINAKEKKQQQVLGYMGEYTQHIMHT